MYRAAVITLSDKGAAGLRADMSGPAAARMLEETEEYMIEETLLIPDEPERLKRELVRLSDESGVDLILTSGGTGFSPRDWTPEATMDVADRNAPGISEYMRARSLSLIHILGTVIPTMA